MSRRAQRWLGAVGVVGTIALAYALGERAGFRTAIDIARAKQTTIDECLFSLEDAAIAFQDCHGFAERLRKLRQPNRRERLVARSLTEPCSNCGGAE